MDSDDLDVFVVAAEELSFTRTAARVHLSKQVVSQRIARLEKAVGARLLDRNTSRMDLTPAGRRVHRWAIALRESWSGLVSDVAGDDGGGAAPARGRPSSVRVAFDADGQVSADGDRYYRDALGVDEVIWARMPITAALESLAAGDLDLALGSLPPGAAVRPADQVHVRTLVRGRLRVLLAERLLDHLPEQLHIADLADVTWAVSPPHDAYHDWEKSLLAEHGITRIAHAMDKAAEALGAGHLVGFAAPNIQPVPGTVSRPILPALYGHWLVAWSGATVSRATADAFHSAALSRFEHHSRQARADDPSTSGND